MNLPKQKKYILPTLILTGLLVANGTWAQTMPTTEDGESSSTAKLILEPISSTTDTLPTAIPKGRANVASEKREALTEVRQTRITNLAANISNRMDAAVERLANISTRLEQRIIKMEESGTETSLARASLVAANENLAMAKLKLADIDTLVNEASLSTKPQTNWQTVRERYQETGSLIRQTHFALRESITALKNPDMKQTGTTTTAVINPNTEELISN